MELKVIIGYGDFKVSARELHKFLELKSNFTTWFSRMLEYGFSNENDYVEKWLSKNGNLKPQGFDSMSNIEKGSLGFKLDYYISLDMAKEISMIQRSEKGKEARQYFIQIEKDYKEVQTLVSENKSITIQELNGIRFKTTNQTCRTFSHCDVEHIKSLTHDFLDYAKKLGTDERIRKCSSAINGLEKLHDSITLLPKSNGDCYNILVLVDEVKFVRHKAENLSRGQIIAHINSKIKELENQILG